MYSETLLDHFQRPRNAGIMESPDAEAVEENPVCGDRLHIFLRIDDGTIRQMRWRAEGCAPALAAASATSMLVEGMPVHQAQHLDSDAIVAALGGLPPRKMHAAQLVVTALRRALQSH